MIEYGGLPDALAGRAFSVAEALAAGLTEKQLRRAGLRSPHYGVRAPARPELNSCGGDKKELTFEEMRRNVLDRCADYAPRLGPLAAFSGPTAAIILGLPLPRRLMTPEKLHIAVPLKKPKPGPGEIESRRLREDLFVSGWLSGLRVLDPLAAFLTCCRILDAREATIMLDAVITTKAHYPGLLFSHRPGATIERVREVVKTLRRFHGGRVANDAFNACRERVASPKETETRLLLVGAGLPEPEVNGDVLDHEGWQIAEVDLLYRAEKIAIEYEGDHHRTSEQQWRRDLERERDLKALGYEYIRVTQETLAEYPHKLVAQITRLLETRAPRPPEA